MCYTLLAPLSLLMELWSGSKFLATKWNITNFVGPFGSLILSYSLMCNALVMAEQVTGSRVSSYYIFWNLSFDVHDGKPQALTAFDGLSKEKGTVHLIM